MNKNNKLNPKGNGRFRKHTGGQQTNKTNKPSPVAGTSKQQEQGAPKNIASSDKPANRPLSKIRPNSKGPSSGSQNRNRKDGKAPMGRKPVGAPKKEQDAPRKKFIFRQNLTAPLVQTICEKQGFSLSSSQSELVTDYLTLLQKWNKVMNLVGKTYWEDILNELVMDSFFLAKFLQERANSDKDPLCQAPVSYDLGAGAGLPGIPLRILWPHGEYYLVEAREKRSLFMQTALVNLKLTDTFVCQERAEVFMENQAQENVMADLIISRAFMPFDKMLPFVYPYLKKSAQSSIVFLTLERLNAEKFSTETQKWYTKNIVPYKIKDQTKFLCEVGLA